MFWLVFGICPNWMKRDHVGEHEHLVNNESSAHVRYLAAVGGAGHWGGGGLLIS